MNNPSGVPDFTQQEWDADWWWFIHYGWWVATLGVILWFVWKWLEDKYDE